MVATLGLHVKAVSVNDFGNSKLLVAWSRYHNIGVFLESCELLLCMITIPDYMVSLLVNRCFGYYQECLIYICM